MEYKNIINIKIKDFQLTENNTYKCLNKQFVDTEHLYVFDYNRGKIFHIDVPINTQNEDIPNILEEYGLKESECNYMITEYPCKIINLTYEDKINIYIDKKGGMSIGSLSSKYKVSKNIINYLTALIDKHGIDILRTDKNRIHTKFEKQEAIDRVLINGEAKWAVALDLAKKGEFCHQSFTLVEKSITQAVLPQ